MTKVKTLIKKAHDVVTELCNGKRRWTMNVPARYDEDPDLIITAALTAAECEIDRLNNLLGPNEQRLELLERLSADHILEETTIFKQSTDNGLELDERTIAVLKARFRTWHNTWIAAQSVKLLGEPVEQIEKQPCASEQ